jgi:hypothetical protein
LRDAERLLDRGEREPAPPPIVPASDGTEQRVEQSDHWPPSCSLEANGTAVSKLMPPLFRNGSASP